MPISFPEIPVIKTLTPSDTALISKFNSGGAFTPPINGSVATSNDKINQLNSLLDTIETGIPTSTDNRLTMSQLEAIRNSLSSVQYQTAELLGFQDKLTPEGGRLSDITQTMATINKGVQIANEIQDTVGVCASQDSAFAPLFKPGADLINAASSKVEELFNYLSGLAPSESADGGILSSIMGAITTAMNALASAITTANNAVDKAIQMLHDYSSAETIKQLAQDPCIQSLIMQGTDDETQQLILSAIQ